MKVLKITVFCANLIEKGCGKEPDETVQKEIYMGRKLTEARANMGKIIFRTMLRVLLAAVILLAGIRGNPPNGKPASFMAGLLASLMILAAAVWVFFPLIHCKDHVVFYENGILMGRKIWLLEELGEISFMDSTSNRSFFARTYMCTDIKNFNITYIKDAKKNFNRAYLNTISKYQV